MKIVGCDLHTRYQQIAMLDTETGELIERRLEHGQGEARSFYASLQGPVRIGVEATGYTRWFERMLAELGHELWIGDAAQIRAAMVRKQKTDARDAAHLLQLLVEERFPRIWRRVARPALHLTENLEMGGPSGLPLAGWGFRPDPLYLATLGARRATFVLAVRASAR